MKVLRQLISRASAVAMLTGLAACGGSDTGGLDFTASQQSADRFVAEVSDLVGGIRQADAADQIPSAGPFGLTGFSGPSNPSLPTGAVISETMNCSEFGTSGSGTIAYTLDYNASNQKPNSITFTYNDCTFGDSGYTYAIDGTGRMTFENYVSESDFTFVLTYDLTYSFSGDGIQETVSIDSTETCSIDGEQIECRYSIGNYDVANFSVETLDGVTTIHEATVEGPNATIVFDEWVYNEELGRATSGTVTITGSNGNSAQITATGTGYTVEIVVNGASSTWTVTAP